jgi:hypothetical protein
MSVTYTQTLIAANAEYIPEPQRVAEFLSDLAKLGSAPLEPGYAVGKLTGEIRMGTDPMTGEPISVARRAFKEIESAAQITSALHGAHDYTLVMAGKGPASNPPFQVFTVENSDEGAKASLYVGDYEYTVQCCLRGEPVSMSDWHEEIMPSREHVAPFDSPCRSFDGKALFHNPYTGAILEVPGAGGARFWIEFECGKWLLPKIDAGLDLLALPIVDAAVARFGMKFFQGCRWG